jgi:hypothetical protein
MIAYAGIGSRNITDRERNLLMKIAKELSKKYILYSGNADGADIAFQEGSNGKCVVFVPWFYFNREKYDHEKAIFIDPDITQENDESVQEFHPNADRLKPGARAMMRRNYHQVMGYEPHKLPKVKFVVCCADTTPDGGVKGGTGQAVRIAKSQGIPVINIRDMNWKEKLKKVA